MGRSVSYLSYAIQKVFIQTPKFFGDEFLEDDEPCYVDFDEFIEDVFNVLQSKYPSLTECKKWDGRETRIFAENNLAEFGISEYCGLTSISVRAKDEYLSGIAENWCNKINLQKIISAGFENVYQKQGSLSNGEGVYTKV